MLDGRIVKPGKSKEVPQLTAHAEGCDWMDEVGDWWPLHNVVAGGDDFSFTIPLKLVRGALNVAEQQIVIMWGQQAYAVMADIEFAELAGASPFEERPA